jgi:hypothetical protein
MEPYSIDNSDESEKVFRKLTDLGYSELVAERIYRWYHPE